MSSDMDYWKDAVSKHFAENGSMIYVLRHVELKIHVTFDSGVERIELILKGAKEYQVGTDKQTIVICAGAALVYHFRTGEQVNAVPFLEFNLARAIYTEMVSRKAAFEGNEEVIKHDLTARTQRLGHMRDLISQTLKGERADSNSSASAFDGEHPWVRRVRFQQLTVTQPPIL
ncbi:hypothetical protein BC829DRAFT_383829 [Chytridium lagenaria]|nr:hypothetical protein BC829DRAFT_383829 [Chytridium lagenaria]